MTIKEEILERLMKEKFISFEEMLVLQEREIIIEKVIVSNAVYPQAPIQPGPIYPHRGPWWLPEVIC